MAATFCDSGAVKLKAGSAAATLTDEQYTQLIEQAESYINTITLVNWTDLYSTLNDDVKKILEDAASCHAATSTISYDMSGYTTRAVAQTSLDVNWARMMEDVKQLRESAQKDFVEGA